MSEAEFHYGPVWTRVNAPPDVRSWIDRMLTIPNPDQFPPFVSFYNSWDCAFLTGHLHFIERAFQLAGVPYVVHNRFQFPFAPFDPHARILSTTHHPDFTLKKFQCSTCRKMVFGVRGGVQLATGAGKTASYIASLKFLEQLYAGPVPSLTILTVNNLARQMHDRMRNAGLDAGILSGGKWNNATHVVGVVNGIYERLQRNDPAVKELLSTRRVLCMDEGHHGQADMCYSVGMACQADFRWTLSATLYANKINPYAHPGDMRIIGLTGPTLAAIPARFLWQYGFVAEPTITFIPMHWPPSWNRRSMPWRGSGESGGEEGVEWELIVDNDFRNEYWRRLIYWKLAQEPEFTKFVVLVQRLEHGRILQRMLNRVGINSVCCYGAEKTVEIDRFGDQREMKGNEDRTLQDFSEGRLRVLIGSQKFDEGQSFPLFTDLILAQAGKGGEANRRVYQRVGRGLHSGIKVHVWDMMDQMHPMPRRQAEDRVAALVNEDYPVTINTPPECQWAIPGLV